MMDDYVQSFNAMSTGWQTQITPPHLLHSFHPFFLNVPWALGCMRLLNKKERKKKETQQEKHVWPSKFLGCMLVSYVLHVVTPRQCALRHLLATWRLPEASSQSCPAGSLPMPQECLMTQSLATYVCLNNH